jgi:predicted phage tail component-like protein
LTAVFGLTFNGQHSYNNHGLIMLSKNRPILAEPKEIAEDAQGRDGEFDYSACNPDEEIKRKPRIQEITFAFDRNKINWRDPRVIRQKARSIAAWLGVGEALLVMDDESDKQEHAKVSNKLDLENQIETGRPFTVYFKCRPFSEQIDSSENITLLDSKVLLDSTLRLDDRYQFIITENTTIEVNNIGTHSVKPVIEITGTFNTLHFVASGKALIYNEALVSGTLSIDCKTMQARNGATNKGSMLSGYYLILAAGINSVQIGGAGLNCTVTFKFKPLYY